MSIKTFKPTIPSRRQMTVSGFDGIDKKAKPEPSLVEPLKKSSGRNSYGRIFNNCGDSLYHFGQI